MPTQFDTQYTPTTGPVTIGPVTFAIQGEPLPEPEPPTLKPWVEIYITYCIKNHPGDNRRGFVAQINLRDRHYDWGHRFNHLNGTPKLLWDWIKQCKRSCRRGVARTIENRGLGIDSDIIRDPRKCIFINTDKHGDFPHHSYWECIERADRPQHADRPYVFGPPNEVIETIYSMRREDRYAGFSTLRCMGPGGFNWTWHRDNNSYTHEPRPGERARTWRDNSPIMVEDTREMI